MKADVVVVGSGAGGSIVSNELVNRGLKVVLVEKGEDLGLEKAYLGFRSTLSSIDLLRCEAVGGTTLISLGNMLITNTIIEKFKEVGIDLTAEVDEVRKLMHVKDIPVDKLPQFAVKFIEVSRSMGLDAKVMQKSIDFNKCIGCGGCAYGCARDAKRTALDLIRRSLRQGLVLLSSFEVNRVHRSQGQGEEIVVEGVVRGEKLKVICKALILAAGALETPRLLIQLHDNDNIGKHLFVDPFLIVGGPYSGPPANEGIQMAAYIDYQDYMLSPNFSGALQFQLLSKKVDYRGKSLASIMVKVGDEGSGRVWPDGIVEIHMTRRDLKVLERGVKEAKNILSELGVKDEDVVVTPIRGAHPGGTAALGYVVSRDLSISGCDGVFVADASLIPPLLGKPPMLLIMALAMKVSKKVCEYLGKYAS
ncbi:MAG: GMC oxidoreductase [Candidatus Nezhaarchaeales archaeon]